VFEDAALEAVRALKFLPAIKNGLPVKNRKTIEVNFDPYEKINTP
jgi:outer membrane biosynthesis protein TonB